MVKFLKLIFVFILMTLLLSCQTLVTNNFVYLGHPHDLDEYSLYYDNDRKMFLLIDSNGCFYKSSDSSGTCLAFNHKAAEKFRKDVLSKMMEVIDKTMQPSHKAELLSMMEKTQYPSIEKPMKLNFKVKRIKQININRQKKYHITTGKYNLDASLLVMQVPSDDGTKTELKAFYSLTLPRAMRKQKTATRPFIIDPKYLYANMQESALDNAKIIQDHYVKQYTESNTNIYKYLENLGA